MIDKRAFEVIDLKDQKKDADYWLKKTPDERFAHIEMLRQINYGYNPATERLQRIFSVAELTNLEKLKINKKASGRHKDLDDLENLPSDHDPKPDLNSIRYVSSVGHFL